MLPGRKCARRSVPAPHVMLARDLSALEPDHRVGDLERRLRTEGLFRHGGVGRAHAAGRLVAQDEHTLEVVAREDVTPHRSLPSKGPRWVGSSTRLGAVRTLRPPARATKSGAAACSSWSSPRAPNGLKPPKFRDGTAARPGRPLLHDASASPRRVRRRPTAVALPAFWARKADRRSRRRGAAPRAPRPGLRCDAHGRSSST